MEKQRENTNRKRFQVYKNLDFEPSKGIVEYGKIADLEGERDILIAYYDPQAYNNGGYHCGMCENNGICEVVFDDIYLDHFKHGYVFAGAMMHELGHFLNGDHKLHEIPGYNEKKMRIWHIEHGIVEPKELKADSFAADNLGSSMVINALRYMRDARIKNGREGTDLAVKEFNLRIVELRKNLKTKDNREKL